MITEKNNVFYCDCGFSWRRGMSGSHNCEDGLRAKLTDMAVQLANAESKCRELAAENVVLKKSAEFATADDMWIEQADGMLDYRYCEWYVDVLKAAMETPATDAFLAEVRARAVDEACLKISNAIINCYQDEHVGLDAAATICGDFAAQLRKGAAL